MCSTTLPQMVIPKIMTDPRYKLHLKERNERYKKRAETAYKIINSISGVIAPKPAGAFYMSVVFEDGVLNNNQKLKIENKKVEEFIEKLIENILPDKRFAYYLMASTGICVVPLTGFNSNLYGFRITLLEPDEKNSVKFLKLSPKKSKNI